MPNKMTAENVLDEAADFLLEIYEHLTTGGMEPDIAWPLAAVGYVMIERGETQSPEEVGVLAVIIDMARDRLKRGEPPTN